MKVTVDSRQSDDGTTLNEKETTGSLTQTNSRRKQNYSTWLSEGTA